MALNGIDVSSYQGGLNLDNVTYDFVMIKATEGTGYVNSYCDTHFQEAKAANKKRAVYHFTDFGDPIAEANYFVDNTLGYVRDAIFVLDWEGAGVADVNKALMILRQIEARIGYKPAIYMSEYVENAYDWSPVVNENFGLILAKYSDYEIDNNYDMSGAGTPPNTTHWPFYFMWQWTSRGHLNGYAGDLDCDIAYLDQAGWDAYAGVQAPVAPEPVVVPVEPPIVADPTPNPVVPPVTPEPTPVPETPIADTPTPIDLPAAPVEAPAIVDQVQASWIVKLINALLKALKAFWNYNLRG